MRAGRTCLAAFLENEGWRHMEALYGAFDRVRRELPEVALENCAGGGGRLDLGMASRFHYVCESDFSHHPLGIRAINALSLFLPPEALCYYHNHMYHAHQTADLDTHLRVTLFATPIFVGFGAQDADRTTPYFLKTKRYIHLAKSFCYPIIAGRAHWLYHHTPSIGVLRPAPWCVLEYAAPDHSRGYCGVFALEPGRCGRPRDRVQAMPARHRPLPHVPCNAGQQRRELPRLGPRAGRCRLDDQARRQHAFGARSLFSRRRAGGMSETGVGTLPVVEDWPAVKSRWDAFWEHGLVDRPLLQVTRRVTALSRTIPRSIPPRSGPTPHT